MPEDPQRNIVQLNAGILFTPRLEATNATAPTRQPSGLDVITSVPFEPKEKTSLDSLLTSPRLSGAARVFLQIAEGDAVSLHEASLETVHLALAFLQMPTLNREVGHELKWQSADEGYSHVATLAETRRRNGLPSPTKDPLPVSELVAHIIEGLIESATEDRQVKPEDIFYAIFPDKRGTVAQLMHKEGRYR